MLLYRCLCEVSYLDDLIHNDTSYFLLPEGVAVGRKHEKRSE